MTPPVEGLTVSRTEGSPPWLDRAVIALGRPRSDFRAAIVRIRAGFDASLLKEGTTSFSKGLLVTGDEATSARAETLGLAAFRVVLVSHPVGLHRSIGSFLIEEKLGQAQVLFGEVGPDTNDSLGGAWEDFVWAGSAQAFSLLSDEDIQEPFYWAWGQHLLATKSPYNALRVLLGIYRVRPTTPCAKGVVNALLELDCPELALRWIHRLGLKPADQRRVTEDLRRAARVHEEERAKIRAANLAALDSNQPEVAACVRNHALTTEVYAARIIETPSVVRLKLDPPVQRGVRVQLFTVVDGRLVDVLVPGSLMPLVDTWRELEVNDDSHTLLGNLRHPEVLLSVLRNRFSVTLPNWRQVVFVIEESLDRFCAITDLYDLSAAWSDESCKLFVGPNAPDQFLKRFDDFPMTRVPRILTGVSQDLRERLQLVERRRSDVAQVHWTENEQYYGPHFHKDLRERLEKGAPIRVMLVTSRYTSVLQYVARDLDRAFRSIGHEPLVFKEKDVFETIHSSDMVRAIGEFHPDVMLLVSHVRPEYGTLFPKGMPIISWIQDFLPQLHDPGIIAKMSELDLVYALELGHRSYLEARGYSKVGVLPFAADTELYRPVAVDRCVDEVAYFTHVQQPPSDPSLRPLYEKVLRLFDDLPDELPATDGNIAQPLFEQALRDFPLSQKARAEALESLPQLGRYYERVRYAHWALDAGIPLAVYGRGWSEIERFKPHSRGVVASGEDLCRAYQRSKVVLNVGMLLHSRVFEALSCGAFVLAHWWLPWALPAVGPQDFFDIGKEVQVFSYRHEFVAAIQRAFRDEPWRRATIEAGRARVLRDHGYEGRARQLITDLGTRMRSIHVD